MNQFTPFVATDLDRALDACRNINRVILQMLAQGATDDDLVEWREAEKKAHALVAKLSR